MYIKPKVIVNDVAYMAIPAKNGCKGCIAENDFELCIPLKNCGAVVFIKYPLSETLKNL